MNESIDWHKRPEWKKKFKQVASQKKFGVSQGVFKILEVAIEEKNQLIKDKDHLESAVQAVAEDAITYATQKGRKDIVSEDIYYALWKCQIWPLC